MKLPGNKLTVVICDPSPLVVMSEPPRHRSVQITLTDEQMEKLALRETGTNCGKPVHEFVSKCFIEPKQHP